jgi:hypothetical protein
MAGNDEIVGSDGNDAIFGGLAQTLFMDQMGMTILREIRERTYCMAKIFVILIQKLMTTKKTLSKEIWVMTS